MPGYPDFKFDERDKSYDIKGELYKRDETWIIRTNQAQAGCENALGFFVSFPSDKVGGEIFSIIEKFPRSEFAL